MAVTNNNVLVRFRKSLQQDFVEVGLSDLLDAALCNDIGAIIVRDTTTWRCLDAGTAGYVLATQGPGLPPVWAPSGSAYLSPAFTAFGITGQSTPIEVGATVSGTSRVFTWSTSNPANVEANSIAIADTTGGTTLASGLANTGSDTLSFSDITNNAPASQVWTITGKNTEAGSFARTYTVNWYWRVYAGTSANVTLTANQIKALSDSSALQSGFAGTYSLSAANYKYFSYPDALGSVSSFRDANTGFLVSMATAADNAAYSNTASGWSYALVSVTNANGIATDYRVYRSQYALGGTLSLQVS